MKIHDITLTISPEMPVWPGDPPVQIGLLESMDAGAHANVTGLTLSAHTGTHLDAPHHFLNNHLTVEQLSLEAMVGPALVIRLPGALDRIEADDLERAAIPAGTRRLLLRTRNSDRWQEGCREFQPDFVAITAGGATWLVDHGFCLVGVDYLSVAPFKQSEATHKLLLAAGIIPLEGLDLHAIEPGTYELVCLPMKLGGADGAPARVILIEP